MLVVCKFTGVHEQPVPIALFIPDVSLRGVCNLAHPLPAPGAVDILYGIPFPAFTGFSQVQCIAHPTIFESFSFTRIEPQALAVGATINSNSAVGNFHHIVSTFGACNAVGLAAKFHVYPYR